ncbi:MAG: type IV pilus twitching motility protein PilT [Planctomycetaceae bacterium]|nr:type IV pilus twitching motility protein PilT [Planctomycetaceae bacterium]
MTAPKQAGNIDYSMNDLLRALAANGGSDLHVTAGSPPRIRLNSTLRSLNLPSLTPADAQKLIHSILTSDQIARLEREKELDTAFGISGVGRFRVNVFYQRGAVGATLRTIPFDIPGFAQLGLSVPVMERLCMLPRGLVVVTGSTASGKSTTLAAMVDYINSNKEGHIVTVENPIEFLHRNKRCLVNQREVGTDTRSAAEALGHVLRQDPDIVLVGGVQDTETMQSALNLAEMGHLVLAELPGGDSVGAVQRIIDFFPPEQGAQVRLQLAHVLEAVLSQRLVKLESGAGRAVALEVLMATQTVRANIREDKTHQLYSAIQSGARDGMVTMNTSLVEMVASGRISRETAFGATARADELVELFEMLQDRGAQSRTTHRVW